MLERATIYVTPQLDDHGQLIGLLVNALRDSWPTSCHGDECGTPTCTLERRLVATWGEPHERVGANDFAVWIDPALRLRATFAWPCKLRFERYRGFGNFASHARMSTSSFATRKHSCLSALQPCVVHAAAVNRTMFARPCS